tara:strand:+ start:210 stop:1262 length:1053 start_codon:yes stop_codon:yes gene_type:complete
MARDIALGILYSGQLETQLIKSSKKIGGIKTIVLTNDKNGPAQHFCDEFIFADLSDKKVIENFVKKIDLCTYAFENLSYEILNIINDTKTVLPSPKTLKIAQNRILEKNFANELGIKTVNWQRIKSLDDLKEGIKLYGNCIMKSVSGGYDGKQQYRFKTINDIDSKIDFKKDYILEKFLKFKQEISVAATRYKDGKISIYEPTENVHENGILRHSKIPANISKKIFNEAQKITIKFAEKLDYVGTLNLEFMIDEKDNLFFNEYANRCHNGFWHSVNSYKICQFENHVRAVCGLEYLSNKKISNAEMFNILGKEILNFREKKFKQNEFFFDYLKTEARSGRKMGHITILKK